MAQWILRSAGPDDEGRRLDRILRILYPDLPLSALHRAFRKGLVRVGGRRVSPDRRIASGDTIELSPFLVLGRGTAPGGAERKAGMDYGTALPEGMLIHASQDLIFLNKPAGMLVHDGEESLEALVRAAYADSGRDSLAFRPGPLHRLDRNTSGIVTFSRSLRGAEVFSAALRERRISKVYLAVLQGRLEGRMRWEDGLVRDRTAKITRAGNDDSTSMRAIAVALPVAQSHDATLACILLETGRTHQIRAQAALHGCPLEDDPKYGTRKTGKNYRLHALLLRLRSTLLSDVPETLAAAPPAPFADEIRSRFGVEPGDLVRIAETSFFA